MNEDQSKYRFIVKYIKYDYPNLNKKSLKLKSDHSHQKKLKLFFFSFKLSKHVRIEIKGEALKKQTLNILQFYILEV